jgi:tetratricopeptide (TPR) repeat protein
MAETLAYQGHVERAGATARQVLDLGRESSDAQLEAWGLLLVGSVQRLAGDLNEAISLLRQSDEMARPIPDYFVQVQASAIIGHCHLDTGHLEPALNSLHGAQRIVEEHNVIGGRFISMVQAGLGRAYLLAAEEERGSDKKSALAQAKRACREARRQTRKYRPFRAQAYRLQGTYEWLIGHERQAAQWWEKSLALAGEIAQPYEQAITYLEMGRRQGVPSLIEQAKVILADLGARPDLMDVN